MKTELIFPTPVWKFDNVGIDKQSLTDFVYYVKSEDPVGRKQTNHGGWQSHDFIDRVILMSVVGNIAVFEPHKYVSCT